MGRHDSMLKTGRDEHRYEPSIYEEAMRRFRHRRRAWDRDLIPGVY